MQELKKHLLVVIGLTHCMYFLESQQKACTKIIEGLNAQFSAYISMDVTLVNAIWQAVGLVCLVSFLFLWKKDQLKQEAEGGKKMRWLSILRWLKPSKN